MKALRSHSRSLRNIRLRVSRRGSITAYDAPLPRGKLEVYPTAIHIASWRITASILLEGRDFVLGTIRLNGLVGGLLQFCGNRDADVPEGRLGWREASDFCVKIPRAGGAGPVGAGRQPRADMPGG